MRRRGALGARNLDGKENYATCEDFSAIYQKEDENKMKTRIYELSFITFAK